MKNQRIPQILLFLLVFASTGYADVIHPNSMQARSDGVNITIQWTTDDELNVARYEIERRGENESGFVVVGTLDPKGPSSYEFVDRTVFRKTATVYRYRVKIVFSNAAPSIYSIEIPVSHAVSSVRRTWGSIKAMFR